MCDLLGTVRGLGDEALGSRIAALETLIRRAQAAQAVAVRAFEVRDASDALGFPSAKAWLCATLGASEREARSLVGLGRAMERVPAVAAAFAEGAATATHVRIAAAASRPLSDETVADGDAVLAPSARTLDSRRFSAVVNRWVAHVAPAEFERDTERRYDSRWFSVSETFGGMHSVQGMLDPEAGALLAGAVASLVAANASDDERTPDQQRADALADIVGAAVGQGAGRVGGVRPEIVVHAPVESFGSRAAAGGAVSPAPSAVLRAAPVAELAGLGPVPQATLERLTCDARWRRLLVDPANVPVEFGRATHEIPHGLRTFVGLRDGGCRYPGCVRGTGHCEAHHVVFWRHGGTTDAANLVLLCRYHHHLVHERRHELKLLPDASVEVTRPDGTILTGTARGSPLAETS